MATLFDARDRPAQSTDIRHPEKAGRPDRVGPAKPSWLRIRAPVTAGFSETRAILADHGLKTVCQEASCPNLAHCWSSRHATFLIMGDICTRACAFCNVRTGLPAPLDEDEPRRIAETVAALGLAHAVITSVDRDDLEDGGAAHFARVIGALRAAAPGVTIEVLTPDFLRKEGALARVLAAGPDVFNHNLETVPSRYLSIRPGARYYHSLRLLDDAKRLAPDVVTKSGLMVGLGESRDELAQVMDDLRSANVDFLTIGQYLQPGPKHEPVHRYVCPEEFEALGSLARAKGFALVAASPLTRSSFHAGEDFARLKAQRAGGLAASRGT